MRRLHSLSLLSGILVAGLLATSVPATGHEVGPVNQPNCDSRARVAERLTGERSNRQYFERTGPGQFIYDGPAVDIYVRRDYVVYGFGGTLVQHDQATLSDFRVTCFPRLELPYTYWPPQGCLFGVEPGDREGAVDWVIDNLGGRSRDWSLFGFFRGTALFVYDGPRMLFTVPKDALVWPLDEDIGGTPLTPGYQAWLSSFRFSCYG